MWSDRNVIFWLGCKLHNKTKKNIYLRSTFYKKKILKQEIKR